MSPKKRQIITKIAVIAALAILAGIPFVLGKYFEFNSPGAFDSGGYVYSAEHILEGAEIGVEEKTSAQLGTLLVNMLGVWMFGFNETGPKLLQAIFQAAALVMMFVAMRRLFGTLPAAAGVIVASVYLSAPVIAKYGNVKEQYMIAFMVIGVSCLVLQQLGGKWWLAMVAGAFLIWAPLFKPTGLSAVGAVGLFILLQAVFKNRTWTQMRTDVLLLLAGAAIAIAPAYIWIIGWDVQMGVPYSYIFDILAKFLPGGGEADQAKAASDYVAASREQISFSDLFPRVMRYYGVLVLPIALALGSVIARVVRLILSRRGKKTEPAKYDRFVPLFAIWWILDMIFIWISPRSYEQYYLPLNASAAMLGGYLIAVCRDKAKAAAYAPKWVVIGAVSLLVMFFTSLHIFRGLARSPHSGTTYINPVTRLPERRNGYVQKCAEVADRRERGARAPWEVAGDYIRKNSNPDDGIYVWGWFPGIYVKAQRLSPAPKAFEGTMHTLAPEVLSERVDEILTAFEEDPPKFIVDTHKRHFPWDRPPLELWPTMSNGLSLIPNRPADRKQLGYALLRIFNVQPGDLTQEGYLRPDRSDAVRRYEAAYAKALRDRVDSAEAQRFEAMKPFRDYVMSNYRVVRSFGQHVLFQRKTER
jgi:hypothetical protein